MSKAQITDEKSSSAVQSAANKLDLELRDAVDKGEIDKIKKILQHNEAFGNLDEASFGGVLLFSYKSNDLV
jgi:hypothetical protein